MSAERMTTVVKIGSFIYNILSGEDKNEHKNKEDHICSDRIASRDCNADPRLNLYFTSIMLFLSIVTGVCDEIR